MNKNEFYRAVAEKTGMTIKDTKTVFETAQEVLINAIKADEYLQELKAKNDTGKHFEE